MTRINIVLDDEIHKKAKINSTTQDKTLIQYINEAVEEKNKKKITK